MANVANDFPKGDRLIKAREVARMLDVDVRTIRRWKSQGKLPEPVELSPYVIRWRLSDIEEFIKRRKNDV
jgi:predicted DNA-binding transcriptional regulator AlpA